jgi:hypothetical protein
VIAVQVLAEMLAAAEAYGEVAFDLWVSLPTGAYVPDAYEQPPRDMHFAGDLTIRAEDQGDRRAGASLGARDGAGMWKPGLGERSLGVTLR